MERKKTKLTISGKPRKNLTINQGFETKKKPKVFQRKKFADH